MSSKTERALRIARTEAGITRAERRAVCGGSAAHADAVSAFHRANRRHSRALCREAIGREAIGREVIDAPTTLFVDGELLAA
jgi:hypothetical protein